MDWTPRNMTVSFLVFLVLFTIYLRRFRNRKADRLLGPASPSIFYGYQAQLLGTDTETVSLKYEHWFSQYGLVFALPWSLGAKKLVVGDTKALQYICAKDTFGYVATNVGRAILVRLTGGGILAVEGESHKAQRKALSSGFSNASIRAVSHVLFEAGNRTSQIWRQNIQAGNGQAIIDVQEWMNRITLDSIGLAGFSHDFESISGKKNFVADAFENIAKRGTLFTSFIATFGQIFPWIFSLPTRQGEELKKFNTMLSSVAKRLLEKNVREREEKEEIGDSKDKSIVGLLIKAQYRESGSIMSAEDVLAQNTILIAGFATTSVSLTWALIELCRFPEKQVKLREELSKSSGHQSSYDELMTPTLYPYLDAVVHETLRMHPSVGEVNRVATEDDIVPLAHPLTLASGETVSSIRVKKDTLVTIPIFTMNFLDELWGANAKEFRPERWLDAEGASEGSRHTDIHGYRHLLTFMDGPRTCLGRPFAVAEFKIILATLIRNFTFELPDGVDTKITTVRKLTPRPKIEGQTDIQIPLLVRAVPDTEM